MARKAVYPARKRGLPALHPGAYLKAEILPVLNEKGISNLKIEALLGLKHSSFYEFLRGERAMTAELALKIGKLCGNGPQFWMALQADYDLEKARERLGEALAAIPTLAA